MKRDSHLPLLIAAVLALGVHLAALSSPAIELLKRITPTASAATLTQPTDEPQPQKPQETPEPEKPEEEQEKPPEPPPPPEPPQPEPPAPPPPVVPAPPPPLPEPPTPQPVSVEVGKEDAPRISTVAWIAWDDYQELVAQQQRTLQPALQRDVIAQPDAPVNTEAGMPQQRYDLPQLAAGIDTPNPQGEDSRPAAQSPATTQAPPVTPPAVPPPPAVSPQPEPVREASASKPADVPNPAPLPGSNSPLALEESPAPAAGPLVSNHEEVPSPTQIAESVPVDPAAPETAARDEDAPVPPQQEQLAMGPVTLPTRPESAETAIPPDNDNPKPDPAPAKSDSAAADAPADRSSKPAAGDGGQTDRSASLATEPSPTSIPLTDREAIATIDKPSDEAARLGRVITSRGIEIKTVRPRFSIATLYTATPRNPRARVVFDATGQVIRAELTRSSGYADIDSPIINSLYQWRATGKMIEAMNSGTFEWQGTILLVDEPELP